MLTDSLILCLSSFNSALGDTSVNLEMIDEEAARAAEAKAQLLLTPELSVCGHTIGPEIKRIAEPLNGPSVERLTDMARRHGLFISAGIAEESQSPDDWPYNTQVLVGPEGLVCKQRKLHLSHNENCFTHPGDLIEHVDIGAWRIGTIICYDNLFPELYRIMALRGCELILAPHAARFGYPQNQDLTREKADTLASARIHHAGLSSSNALFSAFVNQVGIAGRCASKHREGWVAHAGGILVAGPDGNIEATSLHANAEQERVVITLDRAKALRIRARVGFNLNTRRPELFRELGDPKLIEAYRDRYHPPELGEWWAQEGIVPIRRP